MTIDDRTAKHIASLHPKVQGDFRAFSLAAKRAALDYGCDYIAIAGTRDWEEQARLYAKGRTSPGPKVTNAKPGSSWHNFGLAMDYGVFRAGKYLDEDEPKLANIVHAACGALAAMYHLEWGGTWKTFRDTPHYQHRFAGMGLAEARRRRAAGVSLL